MAQHPGFIPPEFKPAIQVFEAAIKEGRLSDDSQAPNYAGYYMYMGTYDNKDQFKNATTRQYLA